MHMNYANWFKVRLKTPVVAITLEFQELPERSGDR